MSQSQVMLEVAQKFIDTFWEQTGETLMICGGFARDMYYGLEPKDIDLIVLDNHHVDNVCKFERDLFKAARMLDSKSTVVDITADDVECDDSYADSIERITSVWSVEIKGVKIDIILNSPNLEIKCQEDAVSHFDANINQFGIDECGNALFMGEYHPDKFGMLVFKPLSDTRNDRLNAKWDEITNK